MKKTLLLALAALLAVNVWGQNEYPTTINSTLKIDGGSIKFIRPETTESWARGISSYNLDETTLFSSFGLYGTGSNINRMYLAYGDSPWNSGLGLYILPNGNVGIGTAIPKTKLHIVDNNFSLTDRNGILVQGNVIGDGNYTAAIGFGNAGSMDAAIAGIQEGTDNNSMGMVFFVHPSSTSTDPKIEAVRISKNGNVGIGTTSPSSLLELEQTTPALTIHGNNINTEHGILRFRASRGTSYVHAGDILGKIEFQSQGSASTWNNCAGIEVINSGSGGYWSPPADIIFKTSILNESLPTEKMRITANGKVGIGVTNPTYKLTVNGTIGAREVKVTSEAWSDFVFEPDYNLMTLKDLETFIKANKHLPEIPTTAEVEKDGISIGEMNAKLLQKVEELTLYVINQNDKMEQFQKELNSLKQENENLKELILKQ